MRRVKGFFSFFCCASPRHACHDLIIVTENIWTPTRKNRHAKTAKPCQLQTERLEFKWQSLNWKVLNDKLERYVHTDGIKLHLSWQWLNLNVRPLVQTARWKIYLEIKYVSKCNPFLYHYYISRFFLWVICWLFWTINENISLSIKYQKRVRVQIKIV